MDATARISRGPAFWALLYAAGMAILAFAQITDAIGATTGLLLMLVINAALLPMMARAAVARARATGQASGAVLRYNRRFMAAMLAYALGLGISTWAHQQGASDPRLLVALALLPALPTVAIVWIMARYLAEETDEYLRHRSIQAALAGLGCVLALGSLWGFLETFGLVPHVWAWWVMPVWALGMGLWQAAVKVRES